MISRDLGFFFFLGTALFSAILFFRFLQVEEKYKTRIGLVLDTISKSVILTACLICSELTAMYPASLIQSRAGNNILNTGYMLLFGLVLPVINILLYAKSSR